MRVAILTNITQEQRNELEGFEIGPNNFIKIETDGNNEPFIDETAISILDLEWLNALPLVEFTRKTFEL